MIKKIIAIAGLILALTPFILFPVCDALKSDGSHMGCYYSGIFIMIAGILIFLLALTSRIILPSILALSCWLIPNRIINIPPFTLCANPEHACRASTIHAVGVIVIIIIALSISSLIIKFVRGK